jgi:hypothetical protein
MFGRVGNLSLTTPNVNRMAKENGGLSGDDGEAAKARDGDGESVPVNP